MGGDDLGSDDELYGAVRASPVRESNNSDDTDNEELPAQSNETRDSKKAAKRKQGHDTTNDIDNDQQPASKKQKSLLKWSQNLLGIDKDEQAAFLAAALAHYTRMSLEDDTDNNNNNPATPTTKPNIPSVERLAKCLSHPSNEFPSNAKYDHYKTSFLDRLMAVLNKKRLKRHVSSSSSKPNNKNNNTEAAAAGAGSPSVLIVCQSARRAVAVLKECTPLKCQAIKLFPKQGSVSQQARDLASQRYGLAVGTPHRLWALASAQGLSLHATQLVVLDAAASSKNYTVCTLPDTAQDCMTFVQKAVLPELMRRKDIKLAFC